MVGGLEGEGERLVLFVHKALVIELECSRTELDVLARVGLELAGTNTF